MQQSIPAVYQDGMFVPQVSCGWPENAQVQVFLGHAELIPPEPMSPAERRQLVKELVEDMSSNTFSADAPKFTRDELHERG